MVSSSDSEMIPRSMRHGTAATSVSVTARRRPNEVTGAKFPPGASPSPGYRSRENAERRATGHLRLQYPRRGLPRLNDLIPRRSDRGPLVLELERDRGFRL